MKRFALLLVASSCLPPVHAQTYADGFESTIAPQFPQVNGVFQLPPAPSTTQLQWLLGELQAGQTTTAAEVNAHFDPAWLATNPVAQTIAFIDSVRTSYPNARITDLVAHTPNRITAVIDSPGSPPPSGYLVFGTRYAGAGLIVQFGVSSFGGSVMYPVDTTLTLTQAADKFTTLSTAPALLVGRIGANGQCSAIVDRNANALRATASIFKTWVLGGMARAIVDGNLAAADAVPLVASELAPGGTINNEPLNTPFPVADLATLMMGISDNTATDLLHQRVGRGVINQFVAASGVADPNVLTPLLGISEQFHLFYSFDLATSLGYVNGTEAFQNTFLANNIVPLGPSNGGPYFHASLLTDGSWRASPLDICAAYSALRRMPGGSEAFKTLDRALGAGAAQPNVRSQWDRVWYKGGSLSSGAPGFHVLTHAWLLEDADRDPFVVIAMSNASAGGIDQFLVQSVTGRMLQLVAQLP